MFLLGRKSYPTSWRNALRQLGPVINQRRLGVASFLLPLLIRSIPQIIAGPYPIGYDTINAYVPFMLDWKVGTFNQTDLSGGWLLLVILGTWEKFVGADPIETIIIVGPLLYGFLGWSLFGFARGRLSWSQNKSFSTVILSSLYFTSLRLSW